jgi:hypothetical protein
LDWVSITEGFENVSGVPRVLNRFADAHRRASLILRSIGAPARVWRRALDRSRELREAACLLIADGERPDALVVLSARSLPTGWAGHLLRRVVHLRVIHDIALVLPSSTRLARPGLDRLPGMLVLCTTDSDARSLRVRVPGTRVIAEPFAVVGPVESIGADDRRHARHRLGLGEGPAACFLGGWWPPKDVETLVRAVGRVSQPFSLVVGGSPLDEGRLKELDEALGGSLIVLPRPLSMAVKEDVYRAVDFAVVARQAGAHKESGLVADAVRHGLPLVTSDHDPSLNRALAGRGWARTFRAGDADDLACVLDIALSGIPRPEQDLGDALGFRSATEQLDRYVLWSRIVRERFEAWHPRA